MPSTKNVSIFYTHVILAFLTMPMGIATNRGIENNLKVGPYRACQAVSSNGTHKFSFQMMLGIILTAFLQSNSTKKAFGLFSHQKAAILCCVESFPYAGDS